MRLNLMILVKLLAQSVRDNAETTDQHETTPGMGPFVPQCETPPGPSNHEDGDVELERSPTERVKRIPVTDGNR